MSLTSQDLKEIKAALSQILQNQAAMMAQIALLMNNLQPPKSMPTSPINSAMTQSFLEGLKLKLKLLSPSSTKPAMVGPQKRKAELPLDNVVNTKHRRAHSQKPEDDSKNNDEEKENINAVNNENTTEFAFMSFGCALLTGLIEFAELPSTLASFMC